MKDQIKVHSIDFSTQPVVAPLWSYRDSDQLPSRYAGKMHISSVDDVCRLVKMYQPSPMKRNEKMTAGDLQKDLERNSRKVISMELMNFLITNTDFYPKDFESLGGIIFWTVLRGAACGAPVVPVLISNTQSACYIRFVHMSDILEPNMHVMLLA